MRATNLRCCGLREPHTLGIDIRLPELSWTCEGGRAQTAWRVRATDARGNLAWDSGKSDGAQTRVVWGGRVLKSRDAIRWEVTLWDEEGEPGPAAYATFELGLLDHNDWKARWICGDYRARRHRRYPVDCFRTVFSVTERPVAARLYATACGVYEARINGERAGAFILAPGITDYRKRVQYQTLDVTKLLSIGENRLEVMLADGWYRGSVGAWGLTCQYGVTTKLLCQLELTFADGRRQVVATDDTWRWSCDGPLRAADNKDGEVVDARMAPSYAGRARITRHTVVPTASNNVPVTEHERFSPTVIITPSGKTVLDFGQNLAGYVEFSVEAHAGQKLRLRFGEMLDADGEFTQKNIQLTNKKRTTPLQRVDYTCREGENRYKTRFAIFGFRYALVEGDVALDPAQVHSIAVYSNMTPTLEFSCSNELINRLVEATVWSAKSNSCDLPTDCPGRERHGWTGDAQIFCECASYLFDYQTFAEKYLRDMYDWQRKSGRLPHIAPDGGADFYMWVMNGSVGWADAGVIMPHTLWKMFGDRAVLKRHYAGMRRYAQFMMRRCGRWGGPFAKPVKLPDREARRWLVNRGQSYGEWLEPADVFVSDALYIMHPHPEVSTAYTVHVMDLMAEVADELGRAEDAREYRACAAGCRRAYQELVELPGFTLDTDRQALLVRPLAFDLLTPRQEAYARERLITAINNYGGRLATGFLSTPLILDVLSSYNLDAAYALLENEEAPGWLCMPKLGATTIWESWEGPTATTGVASLNHYSKGAVCVWLFKVMCGISVAGERRFRVAPRPGGHVTRASCRWESPYGTVACLWERTGNQVCYHVEVPANTAATVALPGEQPYEVGAGTYEFVREDTEGAHDEAH